MVADVAETTLKITFEPGRARMRTVLPESEEQVESATARVRPLVLDGEPSKGLNAVNALAYMLRDRVEFTNGPVGVTIKQLREGWKSVEPTVAPDDGTPYSVHLGEGEDRESNTATALGWAWVYGDVVHSDQERRDSTRLAGVEERYRAGAILTCRIIIQAVATLNVINALREAGLLNLPDEPFTEEVVVADTSKVAEVEVWAADHDPAADAPSLPQSVDDVAGPEFQQWTLDNVRVHTGLEPSEPGGD